MNKFFKIAAGLLAVIVVVFAGAAIFVGTLDANKYRPRLVQVISEKTGRAVKLNGPIAFSLGLSGVKISIQDASIGNPAWASRPNMAGMGKFELGVGLLPLLTHSLSINELSIENADILLETNAAGQHNWDFATPTAVKPVTPAPASSSSAMSGESLSIDKLSITNSQLAMRGADGKVSSYNVSSLKLGMKGVGAELSFKGDANGAPITIEAKTGITDLLSKSAFPFDATVTYNNIKLTAKGTADQKNSKADISAYEVSAGKTVIDGKLSAMWGGARPSLHGTLTSPRIDTADFSGGDAKTAPAAGKNAAPGEKSGGGRMFSDAPLPLAGLKAADADLDISVGEFPMGKSELKQISAKLVLANGNLNLVPVKANVGASPIDLQLKLNAAQSPAHLTVGIIANGVDLGDLQKLGSMSPFMTGKAGANIQLTGEGDSAHALASSLGGVIVITAEKGEILTGAAASMSSVLAKVFNPQGGDAALNCLAARFNVAGGVMKDNGILIDSVPSTVSGKGSINLGSETVDLVLRAKTKLVDIGGLVPAVEVSGTLEHPGYSVDAQAVVQNVVGSLLKGNVDILSSTVPDIQAAPAGQNACVYTLDHPKAAATGTTLLPGGAIGNAGENIKNIGNSLVKGLLGQ